MKKNYMKLYEAPECQTIFSIEPQVLCNSDEIRLGQEEEDILWGGVA